MCVLKFQELMCYARKRFWLLFKENESYCPVFLPTSFRPVPPFSSYRNRCLDSTNENTWIFAYLNNLDNLQFCPFSCTAVCTVHTLALCTAALFSLQHPLLMNIQAGPYPGCCECYSSKHGRPTYILRLPYSSSLMVYISCA